MYGCISHASCVFSLRSSCIYAARLETPKQLSETCQKLAVKTSEQRQGRQMSHTVLRGNA